MILEEQERIQKAAVDLQQFRLFLEEVILHYLKLLQETLILELAH